MISRAALKSSVALAALLGTGSSARAAFDIVISPDAGLQSNGPALAAFNRAAAQWERRFTDNVTINIAGGLSAFTEPGIIGSANSVVLEASYTTIRNAMVNDAANEPSNAIVASLPTAANFTAVLPAGRSLSGNVAASKANFKALGFTGLDAPVTSGGFGANDATITFNNAFSFDYDNSNGVSSGAVDFETVALHEIGHALGFFSAVDDVDQTTAAQLPTVTPITLDLFRFANNVAGQDPSTAAEFGTFARNLVPGQDAVTDDISNEYRMSTGVTNGDGRQASHWKDDVLTGFYIGVMDPTLASGTIGPMTAADVRAFDLIGYDVAVPEPTTLAVLAGLACLGLRRRRHA